MGRTIGIDTGGTFTDLVLADGDELSVAKVPSTPGDPVRAMLAGLTLLGGARAGDHVVHGTTVALNALLTGNVARVALVTNAGCADVVEIGRQDRADIYALHPHKPVPLVPRALRFEVSSRVWPSADGRALQRVRSPGRAELERLARAIAESGAESVAIGLLHSYADARDERQIARVLGDLGLPLTCSGVLWPEHREFERFSTALVNAALVPLMRAYLGSIEPRLCTGAGARLSLLQSTGGTLSAARAAEEPVRVLFSGPAGGVVGAARAARSAGLASFVGLDMGGTSTDVSFHDARHGQALERALEPPRVAGHPVGVPALDLHTIGCGGGSLVRVDAGGILHVGPESAGAVPGPVAYGASKVPTVTDAHVQLGHVHGGPFLGGRLQLDARAVQVAYARLAHRLGCSAHEAARAVLDVARASMRRALGVMTMQRGQDPARLALVAFGGAGGLHACALAASLGMRGALVPRFPGALSAAGMTAAEPELELVQTLLEPLAAVARRRRRAGLVALVERAERELMAQGAARRELLYKTTLDLRYRGQSFELRIPDGPAPEREFHRAHQRLYGYALPERELELVCLRVSARVVRAVARAREPRRCGLPRAALREFRPAIFTRRERTRVLEREALPPGCTFSGPACVEEYSGTTLVPPGWRARVTAAGHLWLETLRSKA
ncbi:MAG: hydantoinase/oxoprolinase family protein [Planctomycetes bacterium]|nr:hydantoinase/oxoprolinase family protein [Planctomycetota bacterium]